VKTTASGIACVCAAHTYTEGNVVGIEIEDASRKVELDRLELSASPLLDLIVTRPAATHGKKWRTVFGR